MVLKTNKYRLEYFEQGSPYYLDSERRRFTILDLQINSILKQFSDGIISGFSISKNALNNLTIDVSDGLALVPTFVPGVENDKNIIEKSNIAVRSFKTTSLTLESFQSYLIYLVPLIDEQNSDEIVVMADNNVFRNATTTESGANAYSQYLIDLPSIDINNDNVTVYINGKRYLGPHSFNGQYLVFPNKRIETDTVQVRVVPKDSLALAIIETGNNNILSIDESVKVFVSSSQDGKSIPQALVAHNHRDDGTELSLPKIKLTSKTKIITGTMVPPDSSNENPNSIYIFQKVDEDDINGFIDPQFNSDFKSFSGTISSDNIRFDELINLQTTENISYNGYFVNPDISQKNSSKIISTNSDGKNIVSENILSDFINVVKEDKYNYIIYPYEIILFINGLRQYDGFWLISDNNDTIKIKFSSPLSDTDVVQAQLNLITELTQVKGLLKTDALSSYSKKDVNAFFSASNINDGYLSTEMIPRISHIGRSNELLIPIPSESEDITKSLDLIYCETTDRKNYRPWLNNVPPLKNVKHINKIDETWYICTNNTLISSSQERLFGDISVANNYREDSPIPLKTDYIGNSEEDNIVPILLTEKTVLSRTETGWKTLATTPNFSSNASLYKKDDDQYSIPGTYKFYDLEIDHLSDNIFITCSISSTGNPTEIYTFANKNINSGIDTWTKVYSNLNGNIKDIVVHNGYLYAIVRIDGIDNVLKTKATPSNVVSQTGNVITIDANDEENFVVGGTLIISRSDSASEFLIVGIETNDTVSRITINRPPNTTLDPTEDLIFPGWTDEVNALESSYDKLFSMGGKIYATSGSILFSGFVPIIASNVVFNTIYSMSILDEYVVIATDTGIYYLQSTFYSYAYGYGWGAGAGIDFFDVFGSVGTHFGYGGGDFEQVYANLYAYGYGFELRKSGIWVKIYNSTFDTDVNTSAESTNHLFSFEYNENSGKQEVYLSCDDGVFQVESVSSPYDISIRNAFCVLGKPIEHVDNVFTNNFLSGSVISYDSTTKYLTVKCNLRNSIAGDTIVFDESSGGVNGNKEFKILKIVNNNSIENLYDIRIDRLDGKFTKNQKINSGNKFRIYPHSDPLVFINNNPQSSLYNRFFKDYDFSFNSQKITFDSALSPSDVVTAISQIKHFYALRGPWDESLISSEKVFLNNKYVSVISGTWEDINIVEYNDFSTSNKVLVKEVILETNQNAFFGFNLSGIEIVPNINNPEEKYTISSNSWNSIRIRSDNPESLQESILTNSSDDSEETISNVSFSIDVGIDLTNSIEILPFGNIGLVSLPSPVLTNTVTRISIPSTSQFGTITHEDIQDALSKHEDGLPHKFSGIKNTNLIQYVAALNNIMNVFDIVSFENLEIDDLSSDRVIDLINSTIENSKLYEQDDAGDYSRYVFNIIYSSDLGGTFALTDKGVYFKPDSNNSTEKWIKKANVVQYMNVSGSPTVPSEFKGIFIGYDNDSDTWTISWGENFRLEERNNGLDNHHITTIDLDPNDSNVVYFATRQHGIYRTTDGGSSAWETLFNPGAFDSQNNINNFRYEFSDFKVSGSKNYVMFALMKNSTHGGLFVSNDDGSNFEKHELNSQVVGPIGNDDYNFINIPRIQDGSDLGISPIVYWGSNNLYRKQYSYGHGFSDESATNSILIDSEGSVTNSPARWKIDIINRQIIDSSSKSDFKIYDIAIRESNTNHLFLATSNGLYKSGHDGQVLSGTVNDYRYIGNQGSVVFSPLDFTGDETIDHTKLWVTFDVSVPEEIFQAGKYFKIWEKPLKLISSEKISSTQVLLYFEYFDPHLKVFYPGNGFDNHTKGYNVRGFSSWNKIGQEPYNINNPRKLLLNNDILYVGTDGRGVFYSTDLGNTFSELNNGFVDLIDDENLKISAFDVDSNGVIYCSSLDMGLFGGGIFKYTSGQWTRIGGNYTGNSSRFTVTDGLTQHNITSFKVNQSNPNIIYAGTDSGAFKTLNGGTTWTSISLPTEYDNVARFFSDKKTAFLGTQFSGIFKTRNKGNLWYQDFNSEEQNVDKIRNTKNWRIWDLRYSGLSDSSENNIYVNVYRNTYTPLVGILYQLESLNNNYVTQQNLDSGLIQIFEDTRKPIYIGQTVAGTTATRTTASSNLKETSYYEFSGSYPGILETFLYNSENQSFIGNITTDGARYLPNNHLLNSQTSNPPILFKHQDSMNDYRRIFGLLLDHTSVNYSQFDGNQTSTLTRSGLFQEIKEYDVPRNDIKNIVNDISTKSNVSGYSICDIIKHPSLNRYYIATESHGVFQADNIAQIKPVNFYRGLGTLGTSSTKLTDSRTDFSTNSPVGSTVYLISNTTTGEIIDSKTISSLDGNNTIVFSTSTATNGEDYFYVITNRLINKINNSTNYNVAINTPTLIDGEYYDLVEDSNNSFSAADVDVKIYPFDIENPSLSNTFVVSSVADGLAYIKRHRLSFRNDGETRLLFYDVSYNPTNEETVVYFQDFYRIEESASSWVGMLLQPNINELKFYKIKSVNSETKSFSITDANGSIYNELSPLLLLNSTSQIYSNVYFSLFNSITDFENSGYILFDFSSFNRINNGLSYFESEYLDDKGFPEIDLKFNKLYFETPILYAATEMGVWKYDTSSLSPSWIEINSGISNLSIKDIVGDNGTNLFVASYGDGVFRSVNSGLLWTNISTSLNHKKTWSISIDPNDSDNLIVGTKNGGVYRTTNATATTPTWTDFNSSIDRRDIGIWNVKATANNPNLMYAWAYGAGVFVSTNAGSNWSQINSGLTNLKITDLDIFYLDSNKVVVSTDGAGLFEYTGTKWTKIKTNNLPHPVVSRLILSKTNRNTIFIITSKIGPETLNHIDNTGIIKLYNISNPQSVYKTTDNGKTWKKVFELSNPDDSRKPLDIEFDSNNNLLISSKHHIYFSDNEGETFVLKTEIDKINSFKNTPLSIINSININPNQSRNVNLIGTKNDGSNIIYVSQDGGKTYRASKIGDQNYEIYELTSTTISKLSTTQDIAISQFSFDPNATITKAEFINNAGWTQLTVQYGSTFQSYLNADFGGGLLSVSGDSKRFNILNKPNDISSDSKILFVDGKLDQFSGSQFKIDGLYSLTLTISSNDNYLIDHSMVNNYIKIKTGVVTNICKIVRYILDGSSATIVFADNTESITAGTFSDASITIGSLSASGSDIDDLAVVYSPCNGSLIYSLNYGYYWITPSTLRNNVTDIETGKPELQAIINGQDFTKSSLETLSFEVKDDILFRSYLENEVLKSEQLFTYSSVIRDGLSRSFNNASSTLYITTASNVYSVNSTLTTSSVLTGIPSVTVIQKPFKVAPSAQNTCLFFADNILYTTTDLTTWNEKTILIDNNVIRSKDIKFIDFNSTNDSELIMSIDVNGDVSSEINGIYVSPNRGGTWNKLKFSAYDDKTDLIFDSVSKYGNNIFYFNANDGNNNSYVLTNNNGILGSTVNGFYYSEDFWISSTSDGITFYINDTDSETNEFDYKFYTFPIDYWAANPTCLHYVGNVLAVGSSKGIDFYTVTITNGTLSLSNHVRVSDGLISTSVSKIIDNGTTHYIVATNQGVTLIPFLGYQESTKYINVDISQITNGNRSNSIIDIDYDSELNRIIFISKDSIYIRESNGNIKYINSENSSLNDQTLSSIAIKQVPFYSINYDNGEIEFSRIPTNIIDSQEIVVVKTITRINVESPVSEEDYINSIQGSIVSVVPDSADTSLQIVTLDSSLPTDDHEGKIIIVNPSDPLSSQSSVSSISTETRSIKISSSVKAKVGDKYVFADSLGSTSFIIYSGTDTSFIDSSGLRGKDLVYSFYSKDTNGTYSKINTIIINISNSTDFEGIKVTKSPQVFIGSNRGLFYLNSGEFDVSEISSEQPINSLRADQNGRLLVGTSLDGLYSYLGAGLSKQPISSSVNDFKIDGIYSSETSSKIIVSSNEQITIIDKDLRTIIDEFDSEYSYDEIKFYSDLEIPHFKTFYKSTSTNKISLIVDPDNEVHVFQNKNTLLRTTNSRTDISLEKINVINDPKGLDDVLFIKTGEDSILVGTKSNLYVSTSKNNTFRKTPSTTGTSKYNIVKTNLIDDRLYLTTDDYKNKLFFIENVSPYSLRPGQSYIPIDIVGSDDKLFNQTIYSVLYSTDGSAMWAGGFGSLYYRETADTEWTEVSYENLSNPFLKYNRLYNSSKTGNPIYAIVEYPNIKNSNLIERESNIIKITNSSGFTLDVVSSGYSFEKDSGRYSLTFSAPVYKNSYFESNRSKDVSMFGNSIDDGIVDFGITSLVEINNTNNVVFGSSHNNIRYLTYPFHYEKDGINKDVSLQVGYRSINENLFEISSAHEKGFVSTSPGILEKYKPSRVINVFESDYDEDLLFVSVFNPGELESLSGKEFFAVSNEKSLDHDHGSLLASRDGGQSWTKIGHNLPVEAFVSDVVDDGNGKIFVSLFGSSTSNCGVWYSNNNGRTFTNMSRNLPNKPIKTLYYSENVKGYPEFGGVLYVGFWGGGVYKLETSGIGYGYSTYGSLSYGYGYENLEAGTSFFDVFGFDFGTEQWEEIEFDIGFKRGKNLTKTNVVDISGFKNEFHESIWVATDEDGVLYSDSKSITTLGNTWTQKNNGLKTDNLTTILASQFNETDVWLGTSNGFYKYNTSENKWVLINNGIPETINIKTIEHDVHFFSTFIPVTWNNVSGSDGTLVLRTPGSVASNDIIDNKTYTKGDIVGNSVVAYVGSGDYSVTEYKDIGQNLDVGKEYFYTFFSYVQDGSDITYTRFPNILVGEIASYDTNYPTIINLSTFEATATEVHYIDATNDRHYGETLVILERTTINDIENLLSQKSSIIDGYSIKYTYDGVEYTHVIYEPIVEGVFIDGNVTSTLKTNTIVSIIPNLQDDELIGYAINPSISQGRIDGNLVKPILFEITDNTDTTITVRERNDRKTVGSVSDMVIKEYKLGDGTSWNINKVSVRKNGLAYTNDPVNPQRVYPVYGPVNRGSTYRASNTVTVISDKLLKAQTITPLYIGTSGSGVFRSIDNGNTFVYKCLSGYVINDIEISIENLKDRTLQNADDAVVYISTTTGLFKSSDGGGTVTQIGVSTFGSNNVEKMVIEIDGDDETIYVNYPGNGIYFSKNAGTTWSEIESDTSTLDINDIDLSEERSREFILTTSGSGIINYIEPFDEKFNINVVSDDKITSVSNFSLHLGDEIINYKDRILVDSILRRSSYSNLKSIQFKETHQNSLEISVKKNNNFIPSSDIYIGENSINAPSNPFRLNKDDDLNYPSHIFDTAFMPNGNIFIATNVGGFISPDGNSWVRSGNYLTPKRIYSVGILKDETVVIGTNNGIWKSSDNGNTFVKDQLSGNSVRAIWQHNYNGVTKTWFAGDFGLRTIVEGDDVIRISTPETFDDSDGIVFSWGSVDDDGNLQPGGMDEKFLEFLNTRREYWIPGSKNNPVYSTGWSGIVVVRNQGTEPSFIPQDDATYREKYRRLVEPPENNTFFDSPLIRPFKTGQVVVKLITNTTNVLDESINKFDSSVSIGQNTFNPDNPFIDMVHLASDYDLVLSNKFNGYPEPSGIEIDYAKNYGDYGGGARLLPETTYYYSLYAFFNRPSTTVFYDLKRPDQLLPEYYPVKFDEYSYDLKMRHFSGSTQILCGDSLSINEFVVGTDNGCFYDDGNGIKQSNLTGVEVTSIKFVETSQKHPILGYGWGYFGQGINYFDVFSISGTLTGYGLRNAGIVNKYAYGVGYEYQNVNKIFAGTNDGIYMSLTKGETFSKVFDFSNTEFNVVNNIIVNSNGEVLASTNIGILRKSTTSDSSWTLIDKVIGSADDTSNGRMLGQSFKINEIIRT